MNYWNSNSVSFSLETTTYIAFLAVQTDFQGTCINLDIILRSFRVCEID